MTSRTRILLVDADFRRRAAISHVLAGDDLHVEPFEDAAELAATRPRDGLLLVHDDGAAVPVLVNAMCASGHWLPIVAYDEAPDSHRVVEAARAGAVDYLAWPFDRVQLEGSVQVAGERAAQAAGGRLREAVARSRIERLTRREREVLAGVADGLSNRLIGEKLAISPRTVEIHRANMLNKMGATHTSEAIRIAIEAALVG